MKQERPPRERRSRDSRGDDADRQAIEGEHASRSRPAARRGCDSSAFEEQRLRFSPSGGRWRAQKDLRRPRTHGESDVLLVAHDGQQERPS